MTVPRHTVSIIAGAFSPVLIKMRHFSRRFRLPHGKLTLGSELNESEGGKHIYGEISTLVHPALSLLAAGTAGFGPLSVHLDPEPALPVGGDCSRRSV